MSIRDVIAIINQTESDGIIDRYAIGCRGSRRGR